MEKEIVIVPGRWTTADGKKIEYKDLSDDHLRNIIRDGYRNPHIRREAKRRKFEVPDRPVDKLSYGDLLMWVESFGSTALSGNKFSKQMLKLWNDGYPDPSFYLNLNAMLVAQAEREKSKKKNHVRGAAKKVAPKKKRK